MASGLRTTTLSPFPPVIQDLGLTPQQANTLMLAQQQVDDELTQSNETTIEQFHILGEEMEARFAGFMQQIQTLQTALMRSETQNRELQSTQTAQVTALQAQLAAKQAQIESLEAKIVNLQAESNTRITQEIQSKAEAVETIQDAANGQVNALTEERNILGEYIFNLKQVLNETEDLILEMTPVLVKLKENIEHEINFVTSVLDSWPSLSSILSDPSKTRFYCEHLYVERKMSIRWLRSLITNL